MTERKLWNGWNNRKTVKGFLAFAGLLYLVVWLFEVEWYQSDLDTTVWQMQNLNRMGAAIDVEPYVFREIKGNGFGLGITVVMTIVLAVVLVHKESFKQNWYGTLRRIPKYRGKYLVAKLAVVSLPAGVYLLYSGLQCLGRLNVYETRVPKALRFEESVEVWELMHHKSVWEMMLYFVLLAVSGLLGSFVLRRIGKDVYGAIVALGGIGMSFLLFLNMSAEYLWQRPMVVGGVILAEVLFLGRHVYRKL